MPTNLPPECAELEARYRAATTTEDKIEALEELLAAIPKHKGTDHLRADLRSRLARLKDTSRTRRGAAHAVSPYRVEREGAGQVAVVGWPNTGKSALVAALTNAAPEVADYPFTTQAPMPGMMTAEQVQIQLVDTPPLHPDHPEPQLRGLIRRADLVLVVVDLQADPIGQLQDAITMLATQHILPLGVLDGEEPGAAAKPAAWLPQSEERREPGARAWYKPVLVAVNKNDDEASDGDFQALCELFEGECPFLAVSARTGRGLDRLRRAIFDALDLIRVYSKPPGSEPDLTAPFPLRRGSTIDDLASSIHRELQQRLKSARVWGQEVFDGQTVGRDYVLHDGDIVELRV
jgi:ribosome-interacting GTPase 1